MAAKGGHQLSQSPRFPAEVWEHIFKFATHVPCTLVPELYEKSECIGDQRSALETALVTKRNLVLVCKWWQHMAMRYLYRVVLIRTGRDILALDHTLRNYAAGNGSFAGMRSPGHWTRRLDIILDLSNESECEDPDHCVKRLAGVIQFLPKLEIVSFAITGDLGSEPNIMPFSVLDALRSSAKSLCILDWSRYNFFPQLHQLEELLRDLPNLRVLRCPELVWADGIIPSSILSSLTTLAVDRLVERMGHPGEGVSHEACVSLREFVYYCNYLELPREFIIRYGEYLTTVEWCSANSPCFDKGLDLLHNSCPNLDRLIFSLPSFFSHQYHLAPLEKWPLPRVSYIGVKSTALTFQELFRFLAHLRKTVSTLRVLQLIRRWAVEELVHWSSQVSTEATMKNLNESPFRVEDDEGNLLSDRLLGRSKPIH
ncbi:hypothetical protein F5141DRAFT_776501 [Pisolithus sp. B1]|nr:hypothetical protein F5141DRAFT_776501 [Pisolithus sp. B1]